MFKDKLALVPNKPGCYLMKNSDGLIIYVGKAKILKNRLSSYFRGKHTGKTAKLVSEINDFEYMVVNTETESLILELNMIKKYNPKYNILLRDDKSYPYIELTNEKVPRLLIVRNINRKKQTNLKLYGPYPNVVAARQTVNLLNRLYPLRKCSTYNKRPCLYFHINQCLGYCTNIIDNVKITNMKEEIIRFLKGDHSLVTEKLKKEMEIESSNLQYERALELKELLDYIKLTLAKQSVELKDNIDRDIFGYYENKGYLSIQVLFIRGSKLIGHHSKILPLIDETTSILTSYICTFYEKDVLIPKEIIIPDNCNEFLIEEYLKVKVIKPLKGIKRKFIEMANENAKNALNESINLITKDEEKTTTANNELKEILKLKELNRIEIFDNSNLFGSYNVSGMVVFIDGKPSKNEYRKYKSTILKNDDYASMREVIYRRYFRVLKDNLKRPDLIIVDGALGQINVTRKVLEELNMDIKVVGLKKDSKHLTSALLAHNPIIEIEVNRKSNLFHYLERMQDEVHNFTINYHKKLRSKGSLESILDTVEGIGNKRKTELLKKYKTITKLKELSVKELQKTIPENIAKKLKETLENNF